MYYYKAADPVGEVVEGELEAADDQQAVARLQERGLIPVRVQPAGGATAALRRLRAGGGRIKAQHIRVFTQELSVLLRAGLPLDRALQILSGLAAEKQMADLVNRILDRVRGGDSLSDALEAQGKGVLALLREHGPGRRAAAAPWMRCSRGWWSTWSACASCARTSCPAASSRPAILLAVSLLSVFVLLTFVVPRFTTLFEDAGRALPLSTQIVVGAGDFLREYWWALAVVIVRRGGQGARAAALRRPPPGGLRRVQAPAAGDR
ncbi:MAG: type II secretion system F family protein [Arhodomonas sp.]|nr:type II secretion system F family protein [Arhodomonas sp.]